ncbi:MAG: hypothetical protein KDD45_04510, partial [Bdellovibrionales bacterium]|nr:hypothetical protein [Bdellovibrionales bacterium]
MEVNIYRKIRYSFKIFGKLPYQVLLLLIKFWSFIFSRQVKVWPRHSYVTGTLTPGYSDLDLTIFIGKEENESKIYYIYLGIIILKKIFPWCGEINIYHSSFEKYYQNSFNQYLLKRDPYLLDRLDFKKKPDPFEASVFLLKNLESDLNGLKQWPSQRLNKWKKHYTDIQADFPRLEIPKNAPFDETQILESVVSLVLYLMGLPNNEIFTQGYRSIDYYLELVFRNVSFYKLSSKSLQDPWLLVLSIQKIKPEDIYPISLSPHHTNFLKEQIKWEIFNLYSSFLEIKISKSVLKF